MKFLDDDYLGQASEVCTAAGLAMDEGDMDRAWALFHEVKNLYAKHAQRSGFSARDAIAIDGAVHTPMSAILELEGKPVEALAHIMYAESSSVKPRKTYIESVLRTFRETRISAVSEDEVLEALHFLRINPDFRKCQILVSGWAEKS